MKRWLVIVMTTLLCLTFTGCGNNNSKVFDTVDEKVGKEEPKDNSNLENQGIENSGLTNQELENQKTENQQAGEETQKQEGNNSSEFDKADKLDINNENLQKENVNVSSKLETEDNQKESSVDVDLTQMSSIMIYSEVYNIMVSPEEYIGKTIKIRGPYYTSYWEDTKKYYHYVIINDATACCSSGLEFIWDDNSHKYPEEYPEDETEIELVGRFASYKELGQTYYYLATDSLID